MRDVLLRLPRGTCTAASIGDRQPDAGGGGACGRMLRVGTWRRRPVPRRGFRRINLSAVSTPQELPLFNSRGAIHPQKADCHPALGTQAEDFAIAILIVVIPAIKAWMK